MAGFGTRVLERTLSHLAETLEQADRTQRSAAGVGFARTTDARVKVVGAILITVTAVSSRQLSVVVALLILLSSAALVFGVNWQRLLATWASGLFFAAVVAVPAIFTVGWKQALLLVMRSEASLTCWLLVMMTTPFTRLLRALRALCVPVVFVAILSMTFRYIFLLVATAQDMLLSRRSRIVGHLSGAEHRRVLVSTTGVLLGKSIQMSEDVYQAMASRGFRGDIHLLEDMHMRTTDWLFLGLVTALSLALWVLGR